MLNIWLWLWQWNAWPYLNHTDSGVPTFQLCQNKNITDEGDGSGFDISASNVERPSCWSPPHPPSVILKFISELECVFLIMFLFTGSLRCFHQTACMLNWLRVTVLYLNMLIYYCSNSKFEPSSRSQLPPGAQIVTLFQGYTPLSYLQ